MNMKTFLALALTASAIAVAAPALAARHGNEAGHRTVAIQAQPEAQPAPAMMDDSAAPQKHKKSKKKGKKGKKHKKHAKKAAKKAEAAPAAAPAEGAAH